MRRLKKFITIYIVIVTVTSCTTIHIDENDAFDAKRTITVDDWRRQNIPVEEINFHSEDSVKLKGWYLKHPQARGTVLYFGGNGFLLAISHDMLMANYRQKLNVFAFDYRGYGQSTGQPSIAGLKKDATAAYDIIVQRLTHNPQNLVFHGHSLGSFLALYMAVNRPGRAVILESPVTDVDDWTGRLVPTLLKPFVRFKIDEDLRKESNLQQIKQLQIPLLIVTGKDDNITPPEMSEKLMTEAIHQDKKRVIIENGGHNDLPQKTKYLNALGDFYDHIFRKNPS